MKENRINFRVSHILTDPERQWTQFRNASSGKVRTAFRDLDVDWKKYNTKDYLFTHDTACCSVATEQNGYWITPPCWELVNANGNAWTTPVLLASFKTFIGGDNFLEHVQIPALSKGKILDAVARPVVHHSEKYGDANIYYVDVLVATDRKHTSLIERIESGKLNTLSMGCHVDGTKVTMADGTLKNIEEVHVGDKVLTHKNHVAVVESTRRRETVPNELHKLSISGLPDTYVTAEHPYWTFIGYDKCKGCGKPLEAHKRACVSKNELNEWCSSSCFQKHCNTNKKEHDELFEQNVVFGWKTVEELKPGNWVAVPLGRDGSIERKSLPKSLARMLGYFLAEGNYQGKDNKTSLEFTFSLNEEKYIDEVHQYALEQGISEESIYIQKRENKSNFRIVIHDKGLSEWMLRNAGEYSFGKMINPELLEYDDDTLKNIVGSYINGDGNIHKSSSKVSVTTVSRQLGEQVNTILRLVGIPSTLSHSSGRSGNRDNYIVTISSGHSSKLIGYCDKCDDKVIIKKVNEVDGYMLRQVKSNESLPFVTHVNNIHVVNEYDDHSFIANGTAVHNCLAEVTQCSICGKKIYDGDKNCEHIDRHLGQMVTCSDGKDRICAELCGACDDHGDYIENSNRFIEISFVEHPAFKGSVVNSFIETEEERELRESSKNDLEKLFSENLFERLRVADRDTSIALKITREMTKADRIAEKIVKKLDE